ncbi:glycoside hydrolase family 5 protein [Pedobacter sp. L105]|uniref:glycoside hydrolase family 5 protein n=1 Tax=Pedobacter sp. L105 TaxID=1641871 RepID=UPI0020B15D56|nr:glycoside hydrolase family 5 protein [Pedobacter sp. L105]
MPSYMMISRKIILKKIAIFSLLCFACASAFAQNGNPVSLHGALSVENGKILDQHHIEPQLRGISLSWSVWAGRKYYNNDVVKWLKSDFNISLLRISMAVEPDSGYLKDQAGQEQLITKTIDAAIKQNLYVLIDWHDHHASKNVEASKLFFIKMAKKYAGKPNVIYEIWNEPERVSWPLIKDYAVQVITEIRKYDANNLIVVGSPAWDQDVDITAKDPISGFKNIAYSFHFYASDPSHQEKLMAKADAAIQMGLPLFVTEWGVGESDGNGVFDRTKTATWLNWLEKNKLSWANWNITDKDETTAILKPGASVKGKWPVQMLTPAGDYIRSQLNELNRK